jgi:hypothetical protein
MTKIAEKDIFSELEDILQQQQTQSSPTERFRKKAVPSVVGYNDLLNGDKRPEGLMGLVWDKRARERKRPTSTKSPKYTKAPLPPKAHRPQPKRSSRPNDPGAAPIVTRRWRDLPPQSLLSFYAQTIREMGEPVLFSLHFSREVHEKMKKSKDNPRDFIAKRMRRHLKGVPNYFVVELTARRVVHIHGALARTDQSEQQIRTGLQKVCGRKKKSLTVNELFFINCKARHTSAPDWNQSFRSCFGDFGWAQYCGKDMKKTARELSLKGSLISCSRTVTQQSKAGHKVDCAL